MGRIFVKNNEAKWNIYSTICDGFLFDNWVNYDQLVEHLCNEEIKKLKETLATLLTDNPRMTVMSYDDIMKEIKANSQEDLMEEDTKLK